MTNSPEGQNFDDSDSEAKIESRIIHKAIIQNQHNIRKNRKQLQAKLDSCLSSASCQDDSSFFFISGKCNPKFTGKSSGRNPEAYRGSKYRGVSKNGRRYQVFIMINKLKQYYGVMETEDHAAKVYDKLAIIFHGLKVTIFTMTFRQKLILTIRQLK